jgi:ubiquinone/menaquinone biosynthesis C-methylase UbiE
MHKEDRLDFWNKRSVLGFSAGSNDVVLKRLEIDKICENIDSEVNILDAGCGNGVTAEEILRKHPAVNIDAYDYAPAMVEAANTLIGQTEFTDRFVSKVGDLLSPPKFKTDNYDLVYTERSLINLDNYEDQIVALEKMTHSLNLGGKILLCESFIEGLNEINLYRNAIGLEEISAPWHNTYLSLEYLTNNLPNNLKLLKVEHFTSTYYFISRVVNAWLAKNENKEPDYGDDVNKLGVLLPSIEICSQTKLMVLEKI